MVRIYWSDPQGFEVLSLGPEICAPDSWRGTKATGSGTGLDDLESWVARCAGGHREVIAQAAATSFNYIDRLTASQVNHNIRNTGRASSARGDRDSSAGAGLVSGGGDGMRRRFMQRVPPCI